MKQIKVSEATELQLNWLVAECEGHKPVFMRHWVTPSHPGDPRRVCVPAQSWVQPFEPSTTWAQGGPIIEREGISIIFHEQGHWTASNLHGTVCVEGPTPLIAAVRCFCANKLGETAEVPEELA